MALSVVGSIVLWEQSWPLLTPFVALVLAHLALWLGAERPAIVPGSIADRRRRRARGVIMSLGEQERIQALTRTSQGVLVVTSKDKTVRVQRVDDGALLSTITLSQPRVAVDVMMSADGRVVLTDTMADQIMVWRAADGTPFQAVSDKMESLRRNASARTRALALAPDGTTFATSIGYEKGVQLWRVSDGELLKTLPIEEMSRSASGG